MKTTPAVDRVAQVRALAALIDADLGKLTAALLRHEVFGFPGLIVDGEKPLAVGTKLNLRRGFPSGQHPKDLGWFVAGYKQRRDDGRWRGYVLVTQNPWIQTTTAASCEAFDVLEPLDVLAA